jgi:uncharacterized protein
MEFEWDSAKGRSNIAKHGFDFLDAREVFDGRPRVDIESPRGGEDRTLSVAVLNEVLVAVTWTRRSGDIIRLISVRRARRAEDRKYRQIYG